MADDEVLADLQRLMDAPSDAPAGDPLAELEALAAGHSQRMEAIVQEYQGRRAVIETQIAARRGTDDKAAREAEIAKIKAQAGIQPAA